MSPTEILILVYLFPLLHFNTAQVIGQKLPNVDVPPILGRPTEFIVVNIFVKIITNAIDFYPRLTFVHYVTLLKIIVPYIRHDTYHNNVGFKMWKSHFLMRV